MTTHAIDPTTRAPLCGSYIYRGDQKDLVVTCQPCRHLMTPQVHVNAGPEHMPLGRADHDLHLQRLAVRGQGDES